MITKKRVIIITCLLLIVLGGYFAFQGIFNKKLSYSTVLVERKDVEEKVSVTGSVISAKEIDLEFEKSGKIRGISVKVGDRVPSGQSLVQLDTAELSAQLLSYQAALEVSQVKLARTLAGTREEDIRIYRTAVEKAEVDAVNKERALADAQANADNDLETAYEDALDSVRTAYTKADKALLITFADIQDKYFNGSSAMDVAVKDKENGAKQDLAVADAYVEAAELDPSKFNIDTAIGKIQFALSSIRDALAYLRAKMDDPTVSSSVSSTDKTSVDTERTAIDTEIISITSAKQAVSSIKITNQTNINDAQSTLDTANASLKKAKNELASEEAAPRQEDINLAQAEVKQAQANVLEAQAKISKSSLRAPVAGIITAIEKEVGETVQANVLVVSMIGQGNFQVEANVSETEIAKIKMEDEVEMTLDALGPNEKFLGKIIEIDPAETVISGVIYYRVASVFNAEDGRIKSGMTVNLDIKTDEKENVLSIPYFVVKEKNGGKYVEILKNGQKEKREIKTGLEGETMVEVTEGLNEGEEVITSEE